MVKGFNRSVDFDMPFDWFRASRLRLVLSETSVVVCQTGFLFDFSPSLFSLISLLLKQ